MTRFSKLLSLHLIFLGVIIGLNIWLQGESVVRVFNLISAGWIIFSAVQHLYYKRIPLVYHWYEMDGRWDKLSGTIMSLSWVLPPAIMIALDAPGPMHNYAFYVYFIAFILSGWVLAKMAIYDVEINKDI